MQAYGYDIVSLEGGLKAWSTALEHTITNFEISKNDVASDTCKKNR